MKFEKSLPVAGALFLLLSWCAQNLLFAEWNAALSRMASTESIYHTYRSTDRLYRALAEIAPSSREAIERHQVRQFTDGRNLLLQVVDTEEYEIARKRGIDTLEEGITFDQLTAHGRLLLEVDAVYAALTRTRSRLQAKKDVAEKLFLALYAVGSMLVLSGSVLKANREMRDAAASR